MAEQSAFNQFYWSQEIKKGLFRYSEFFPKVFKKFFKTQLVKASS